MGYTTDFSGRVEISPPLNTDEIAFLTKFNKTRRMDCAQGPYYVDRGGFAGQADGPDVTDYNSPPAGQPGLWCGWAITDDGAAIEHDGSEKFYDADQWMVYLIDHFLKPGALAAAEVPGLQANHTVNGTIKAQGEDIDDRWRLIVTNNAVSREDLE